MPLSAMRSFVRPRAHKLPHFSGPALVLGSGPGAALPEDFDENWVFATVNASQATAARLDWRIAPDITLLGTALLKGDPKNLEAQAVLAGGHTGAVICIKERSHSRLARLRLLRLGYSYQTFHLLTRQHRLAIVSSMVQEPVTEALKPSNGIFLALFCLHLGCSKVVMSGFSLSKQGHAYNDANRPRRHVSEDRDILQKAVARGARIATNQPDFAAESGLPLTGAKELHGLS